MNPNEVYCFFGHHKCATSWVNSILMSLCSQLGLNFASFSNNKEFGNSIDAIIQHKHIEFFSYTNADYCYVDQMGLPYTGFHIIRDPRDIVTSAYFSHLHSHSTENWDSLVEHRKQLQSMPMEKGINAEIDFRKWQLDLMRSWNYNDMYIFEIKMEQLVVQPVESFIEIFRRMNLLKEGTKAIPSILNIMEAALKRKLCRNKCGKFVSNIFSKKLSEAVIALEILSKSFTRITQGRKTGEEDKRSHYRKGTPGDWRNYFTELNKKHFKDVHGDIVVALDYENNNDW